MKTDIKFLNTKEVMEKEMVRDSISEERVVEKQEQSLCGRKPKAASAGETGGRWEKGPQAQRKTLLWRYKAFIG